MTCCLEQSWEIKAWNIQKLNKFIYGNPGSHANYRRLPLMQQALKVVPMKCIDSSADKSLFALGWRWMIALFLMPISGYGKGFPFLGLMGMSSTICSALLLSIQTVTDKSLITSLRWVGERTGLQWPWSPEDKADTSPGKWGGNCSEFSFEWNIRPKVCFIKWKLDSLRHSSAKKIQKAFYFCLFRCRASAEQSDSGHKVEMHMTMTSDFQHQGQKYFACLCAVVSRCISMHVVRRKTWKIEYSMITAVGIVNNTDKKGHKIRWIAWPLEWTDKQMRSLRDKLMNFIADLQTHLNVFYSKSTEAKLKAI